jgi:hypothetical protein
VWLGLFVYCFKINLLFAYPLWHIIGRLVLLLVPLLRSLSHILIICPTCLLRQDCVARQLFIHFKSFQLILILCPHLAKRLA